MAFSELYTGTDTIGTTKYSLTNSSTTIASRTTDAVLTVWLDLANMASGDEYQLVLREKVTSGGSQMTIVLGNPVGAQGEPFVTGPFQVMHGWDVTLQKIAGTDRSISWSIRAVQ